MIAALVYITGPDGVHQVKVRGGIEARGQFPKRYVVGSGTRSSEPVWLIRHLLFHIGVSMLRNA